MKIAFVDLKEKVLATLTGKGFSDEDAKSITDYLLWAEASGIKTQGIIKMTGTEPLQNIQPKHEIKIERDTKLSQLINGGANPAPRDCFETTTLDRFKTRTLPWRVSVSGGQQSRCRTNRPCN